MLVQSGDGYLWFASVDGPAVRFDGVRFVKIDSVIAPTMQRGGRDYVFPIGAERDGAVWLARHLGPGKRIATILCDTGFRYLSSLYNPAWLEAKGLVRQTG